MRSWPDRCSATLGCAAEAAYKVLDASDGLFDADNPAICPAGEEDTTPTSVTVDASKVTVAFASMPDMPVYGFRVTIAKRDLDLSYDADSDVYVPLEAYNNKVFRYYTEAGIADIATNDGVTISGSTYHVAVTVPAGTYKVEVDTINMDGSESVAVAGVVTF